MTLSVKVFRRTETETVFVGERVLDGDVVTIGRGSTCTLQLPDPGKALSRVQVELSRAPGGYRMTVASQYFPVIVNDRSHEPGSKMMIFPGDSIVMDVHELEIVSVEEAKAPAQVPAPNVAAPPPVVQRPARAPDRKSVM